MDAATCPFCHHSIEKYVFDSAEWFLALYNRAPIVPGHVLVVPRRHYQTLGELPGSQFSAFFEYAHYITQRLKKAFNAEAFNWSLQEGFVAGQTVMHLHLHIIVRQNDDLPAPGRWYAMLHPEAEHAPDSQHRALIDDTDLEKIIALLIQTR